MLTFFGSDDCSAAKVSAVAKATSVQVTMKPLSEAPKCPGSQCAMTIPALQTPQGMVMGGNATCHYIASLKPEQGLLGNSVYERAKVISLLDATKCGLECDNHDGSKVVAMFNHKLEKSSFLAGDRMTLADIVFAVAVNKKGADISAAPHVKRLVDTTLGFCGVTVECCKNASKENQKPEPKAAPAAPAAGGEEDDMPKKKSNPLDSLPPSPMDLDAWKRCYSNIKTEQGLRTEAMDYLWKNFDAAGWSFWFCDNIKDEGEGTQDFMSSNMAKGYLQCVEPNFRKYSFGILDIVGEKSDPNGTSGTFDIKGVMMVRGHELPAELAEHRSCDSWKYTKMDHVKDKKLIEEYFCSFDNVEGRKIHDSKVWK